MQRALCDSTGKQKLRPSEAALRLTDRPRQLWLQSYVEQLLTRDATLLDSSRDPARLRKYFEALALHTAGLVETKTMSDAAGITQKTAHAYESLLVNLMVLERLSAWTSNRLSRLIKAPKRYLMDPALVTSTLGLDLVAILRDGNLLGRILDTFVMAQIRPAWSLLRLACTFAADALMVPLAIVVLHKLSKQMSQMCFAKDHKPIQTLFANRSARRRFCAVSDHDGESRHTPHYIEAPVVGAGPAIAHWTRTLASWSRPRAMREF